MSISPQAIEFFFFTLSLFVTYVRACILYTNIIFNSQLDDNEFSWILKEWWKKFLFRAIFFIFLQRNVMHDMGHRGRHFWLFRCYSLWRITIAYSPRFFISQIVSSLCPIGTFKKEVQVKILQTKRKQIDSFRVQTWRRIKIVSIFRHGSKLNWLGKTRITQYTYFTYFFDKPDIHISFPDHDNYSISSENIKANLKSKLLRRIYKNNPFFHRLNTSTRKSNFNPFIWFC